jgi:hypothetical protein
MHDDTPVLLVEEATAALSALIQYRDAVRAPLLKEIAALNQELNTLRQLHDCAGDDIRTPRARPLEVR